MAAYRFILFSIVLHLCTSEEVPYLNPLTEEQQEALNNYDDSNKQFMWEMSGQYEGDMVLTPEQKEILSSSSSSSAGGRVGLINPATRWPNRELPFEIDPRATAQERAIIDQAVRDFQALTCVRLRPRTNRDVDHVFVTLENTGCWSFVGRLGGRQNLNLQRNGCFHKGIVIHEFLHALGVFHEQSSPVRDNHVQIRWQNIQRGMEHNFDRYPDWYVSVFGQPYDYWSVMHYSAWAFSTNGQPTIVAWNPNIGTNLGQINGFSNIDRIKINRMYGC